MQNCATHRHLVSSPRPRCGEWKTKFQNQVGSWIRCIALHVNEGDLEFGVIKKAIVRLRCSTRTFAECIEYLEANKFTCYLNRGYESLNFSNLETKMGHRVVSF